LGARGENDFKLVQMNLERIWRKEIQKKRERGRRCWANPASLSAQQATRPASPLPLPPARGRASLHPAPATWRPYAGVGRAAAGLQPPLVGTPAQAPRPFRPFCPPRPPSPSSSARTAQQQPLLRAPLPERAPPLVAGHTRASSSTPRAPGHSPSLG
jgi:hypothetical protein